MNKAEAGLSEDRVALQLAHADGTNSAFRNKWDMEQPTLAEIAVGKAGLARASEICREYYAVMGAYGQPWCEQWNGEMWGHWRDQDGRILRALGGAFMEKTNLETMTDQQLKPRTEVTAIEAQRETRKDSGFRTRTLLNFAMLCVGSAATAYGQTDPWSTAAGQLSTAFTGPIAKGFALVAIVLGGLQLAFSEGGHSRVMGGLIFGVGLALGAATFLSWITT